MCVSSITTYHRVTIRSFPQSRLITGFVTRVIRRVSQVSQNVYPSGYCNPVISRDWGKDRIVITTNRTSVNRLKRNSVRIENLHVRNLYLFYLWTRSSLSIDNTKVDSRSCIGALVISTLPLSTILIFDLGIVPTMWYVSFFYFIIICFQIIHDRNVSLVSANAHIQWKLSKPNPTYLLSEMMQ
jgi:hypothetical protein